MSESVKSLFAKEKGGIKRAKEENHREQDDIPSMIEQLPDPGRSIELDRFGAMFLSLRRWSL